MGLRLSGPERRVGGPPGGPLGRLIAVGLVLAFVLSIPSPAAAISVEDTDFLERAREGCPDRWWGVGGSGGSSNHVCLYAEAQGPDGQQIVDLLSGNLDQDPCPQGFFGTVVHRDNATLGLCARIVYEVPEHPWPVIGWDLSACEIPEHEGEDPVILVADGGVGFCVVPVLNPGDAGPEMTISTEPCEPETTDPEVRTLGGGARICLDVNLYGIGNSEINLLIGIAETVLDQIPGYVPTP